MTQEEQNSIPGGDSTSKIITIKAKGNYNKAFGYFRRLLQLMNRGTLDSFGRRGVEALASATPIKTGKTAQSWDYEIDAGMSGVVITWSNTNVNNGFNVAIGLQYGHGTNNGGYVQGIDYVNPAIQPVFEAMAGELWKEVTGA